MGKLRVFLLLLTALCLIGGAMLPRVVAQVTDRLETDQVVYGQMQSVQLEFQEDETLTAVKKLALVRSGNGVEVSESFPRMTRAEVLAAVDAALEPYIDAGLIRWNSEPKAVCTARLLFDEGFGWYGYFWEVYLNCELSPYEALILQMDDETGQVITIYYTAEEELYPEEELSAWLETFLGIYQERQDLGAPLAWKDTTTGERIRSMRYRWTDGEWEETVEFAVYTAGFYCYLCNGET